MPADALDPSDAPARDVPVSAHPTEQQRAMRAVALGAALGALLAVAARRRVARRDPR